MATIKYCVLIDVCIWSSPIAIWILKVFFLIVIFFVKEHVFGVHENLTLEIQLTSFENGFKFLVIIIEDLVEY